MHALSSKIYFICIEERGATFAFFFALGFCFLSIAAIRYYQNMSNPPFLRL